MKFKSLVFLLIGVMSGIVGADSRSTPYPAVFQESGWRVEAVDSGIKPAIAIDANDVPHVAYIREDIMGGTFYATPNDEEWSINNVSEGYFYGPLDIAVTAEGTPYIAYHDHEADNFDPQLGNAVVATNKDGNWSLTTIDHPGHDGWDNAIVLDSDENWHASGVDPEQFGSSDGVEYATNASGSIVVEDIESGAVPYEFNTSIDITHDGIVGISYFKASDADLFYAQRDEEWTNIPVDTEGDVGRFSDFSFDSSGNPHISYLSYDGGSSGTIRYAHADENDNWIIEDIATVEALSLGHFGARKITALELDEKDQPHIIFSDTSAIWYAQKMDGQWTVTTIYEAGERPLGQLVEMALDSSAKPHIVFFEVTNAEPLDGEIFYLTP